MSPPPSTRATRVRMVRVAPLLARIAALAVLLAPLPALAQGVSSVVLSSRIDDVAVTVYRAPSRGRGGIDARWPRGFAFITETRTVTLPAGASALRFEGVAAGLLDRTSVGLGTRVSVRVELGGGRSIKKKTKTKK